MTFPAFFDDAPVIRMRDGLAKLLGTARDGVIEYRYADAARLAGHSCPTVAGAWLSARAGLRALIPLALAGSPDATSRFGPAWQDRVRRLLIDHADDPAVVSVRRVN